VNDKYCATVLDFCGDKIQLTFDELDFIRRPTINWPFTSTAQESRAEQPFGE
jgi:hypothetical protein